MVKKGCHESIDKLRSETRSMHRAITSLIQELEVFDWYSQRVDTYEDGKLRAMLDHNRDAENRTQQKLLNDFVVKIQVSMKGNRLYLY